MCVSCGCGNPNDNRGDSRNITMNDIDLAAQAAGTSREQVAQNIMNACMQSSAGASRQQTQRPVYGQSSQQQPGDRTPWRQQEPGH